jgi:hypothetical protein
LPGLLAAAREQERANIQLPKTKRASTRKPTTQRRAKTDYQPVNAVPAPGVEQERLPVALSSGHAKAAIALSRRKPVIQHAEPVEPLQLALKLEREALCRLRAESDHVGSYPAAAK